MCRCGGLIRGVLTSQGKHNSYVKALNRSIDTQKTRPTYIITGLVKSGEVRPSDIGHIPEEVHFPFNVYHFTIDPETFEATQILFASPYVTQALGNIALKLSHEKCKAILYSYDGERIHQNSLYWSTTF